VHLDPVGSEDTAASELTGLATEELIDREDEPAEQAREGLPARFRMRHSRHYVDELLGESPLRTVREIAVAEIESPLDDSADLGDLEGSIRRLGVLEPLLVGRGGAHYRVIAGMRRLRAARKVGLGTVPCLVHDVDDEKFEDMRQAAMQRSTESQPSTEPTAPASPMLAPAIPTPTTGEAVEGLEFVSALLPAMNAAGSDRLRWTVLTDLAGVELLRARTISASAETLSRSAPIERTAVRCATLFDDVMSAVATEARLRCVRVEMAVTNPDYQISLDASLCRSALIGLMQCLLAFAARSETVLTLRAQVTSVRPALIVECALQAGDVELSEEALKRFFDAEWREHPSGTRGAQVLAAVAKTAHVHGGRVEVRGRPLHGCAVTFVVPRPLSDI